ncbi:MAG TPA: FmdB family zinc ribbon protein [Tepidisphaeraceae bacterium]|jgi:putative FmdB family regulatory protein
MPTYEYKCSACGHKFEKFHSMTASPIRKCPKCAKNKVKRLIGTGAGLIFKGSGFYITDYRSEGYKESAKADSAPTGDTKKSDAATTTESKPSEKKEAAPSTTASEPKPAPKSESKPESRSEAKASKKKSS